MVGGKEKLDNCLSLAARMKGADENVQAEVGQMRDDCVADWEELVKQIKLRGQKLGSFYCLENSLTHIVF